MRSTQLITGALAVAATSALIGLGTAPGNAQIPDSMQPGTARERGALIECTGHAGKTKVLANVYQNRTYGNYLEITVNNDGGPPESWTPGIGLKSIVDRAEECGGTATVGPTDEGWEVVARFPTELPRGVGSPP